jgi:hypothetical protein
MELRRRFVENTDPDGKPLGGRWGIITCEICYGMVTKVEVPEERKGFITEVSINVMNDGGGECTFIFDKRFFGDFDPGALLKHFVICAVNNQERFYDDGPIVGPSSEFTYNELVRVLDGPHAGKTFRRFEKRNNRLPPLKHKINSGIFG